MKDKVNAQLNYKKFTFYCLANIQYFYSRPNSGSKSWCRHKEGETPGKRSDFNINSSEHFIPTEGPNCFKI